MRPTVCWPCSWRRSSTGRPERRGLPGGLDALLETLADLKLVMDLPTPGRRERSTVRVTERTPEQARRFEHFGLTAYHATGTR